MKKVGLLTECDVAGDIVNFYCLSLSLRNAPNDRTSVKEWQTSLPYHRPVQM